MKRRFDGYFCYYREKWKGCKKHNNICCYVCEYFNECKKELEFRKWMNKHCEFEKTYCPNMV